MTNVLTANVMTTSQSMMILMVVGAGLLLKIDSSL
jgi:hypothetical protein